jgi:hypothetical protein
MWQKSSQELLRKFDENLESERGFTNIYERGTAFARNFEQKPKYVKQTFHEKCEKDNFFNYTLTRYQVVPFHSFLTFIFHATPKKSFHGLHILQIISPFLSNRIPFLSAHHSPPSPFPPSPSSPPLGRLANSPNCPTMEKCNEGMTRTILA